MCLDAQGGIKAKRSPLWLLECGLVNVLWWSSKRGQRDCVFRISCLTTILDSWSLKCENTHTLPFWEVVFSDLLCLGGGAFPSFPPFRVVLGVVVLPLTFCCLFDTKKI